MNRSWTKHGVMTEEDKVLIKTLVDESPIASRIFVTGEVHEDFLGVDGAGILYAANDTITEPLFIQTRSKTVQMARFDASVVWRCFDPNILTKLISVEEERLGLKDIPINEPDFYASMIDSLKDSFKASLNASLNASHGEDTVPVASGKDIDSFYQYTYLSCLWLYGKGGYMAIPVSRHFAISETASFIKHDLTVRILEKTEIEELEGLKKKYGNVKGLTNAELNFIVKLGDNS